ncbi:MAG: flagella basal body P-ring formation protein FlgA, partial [Deltaproteobacteria bacterium RIFOXYD12_FULL_50_9]
PGIAIGKRLNTSLTAGAILYAALLTSPPLVARGDLVTIQIRTANLLVTVPGEVRNGGAAGDLVRVKNLMSRKEIFARVIDPGTVEVPYK